MLDKWNSPRCSVVLYCLVIFQFCSSLTSFIWILWINNDYVEYFTFLFEIRFSVVNKYYKFLAVNSKSDSCFAGCIYTRDSRAKENILRNATTYILYSKTGCHLCKRRVQTSTFLDCFKNSIICSFNILKISFNYENCFISLHLNICYFMHFL